MLPLARGGPLDRTFGPREADRVCGGQVLPPLAILHRHEAPGGLGLGILRDLEG